MYRYEVRVSGRGYSDHLVKRCLTYDQAKSVIYIKKARVRNDDFRFYIKTI